MQPPSPLRSDLPLFAVQRFRTEPECWHVWAPSTDPREPAVVTVAIVEPGGSIRDKDVIAAASGAGVTLYFTGTRHFAH